MLTNFKECTSDDVNIINTDENYTPDIIEFEPQFVNKELTAIENEAILLTSTKVCQKLLAKIICKNCKTSLTLKESESDCIQSPSMAFKQNFKNVVYHID